MTLDKVKKWGELEGSEVERAAESVDSRRMKATSQEKEGTRLPLTRKTGGQSKTNHKIP